MDEHKAKEVESRLKGKPFRYCTITELINFGKSAAVFRGTNAKDENVAIKIFDDSLVERFGHEIQERRIEQEIELRGHTIPNLVRILDGGNEEIDETRYWFIVMEFVRGQNLKQFISSSEYDNAFIKNVVKVLFSVSEALLKRGIVHRDIKPENIMIGTAGDVTLMDLGVLKLIGAKSFTDYEEKQFLGTLRYSPPEFLTRTEEDSVEGWRSVNLYQIGGVMHDLIMKEQLFATYVPYSNLVLAIKEDAPQIYNSTYPFSTNQLARDLLAKDFKQRLLVCANRRLESFLESPSENATEVEKEFEEILSLTSIHSAKFEEIERISRTNQEKANKRHEILSRLANVIDDCVQQINKRGIFSISSKVGPFKLDFGNKTEFKRDVRNVFYVIEGNLKSGFPIPLVLLVRTSADENSLASLSLISIFFGTDVTAQSVSGTNDFFATIKGLHSEPRLNHLLQAISRVLGPAPVISYEAFGGTLSFDDQFSERITFHITRLIKASLKGVSGIVKEELGRREKLVNSGRTNIDILGRMSMPKTLVFNSAE